MFEKLIEDLSQEKITYPANQYDKGWNGAIDYIISQYLEAAQHGVQQSEKRDIWHWTFHAARLKIST